MMNLSYDIDGCDARQFPSRWTMSRYCGYRRNVTPGREFLEAFFGGYATLADLSNLETRILEITVGCSVIPRNDPEGP